MESEANMQRGYYAKTADKYNEMHSPTADPEHTLALSFMTSMIPLLGVRSVLDVGSGTGRALLHIKEHFPDVHVTGVEPVEELRRVGYESGLSADELRDGDATNLSFDDDAFDVVCAFAVLHHIKEPGLAVAEMLRVAKTAIFISDSNIFGQGSVLKRAAKQSLRALGLWRVADLIKTRGKGYTISEGDGLAYSYSVFSNYEQIRESCDVVHLLNTRDGGVNPYRTASHVALLGVKG